MDITLKPDEKILVVSPHPDDESIGCGGLLSVFKGQCDVMLVTDGYNEQLNNQEISEIRQKEFVKAANVLGVNKRIFLHIPEGKIKEDFKSFLSVDYSTYRYVFVPNKFEEHKDHFDVYTSVKKALKHQSCRCELIEYEVWTTIRRPNIKLDISEVIDRKIQAIEVYQSQLKELDYVGMTIGLNSYRGKGRGCEYAEVFYSEQKARRKKVKDRKAKIKKLIKH